MANTSKHGNNPNLKIAAGALVCEDCELIGDITVGTRTVIHPKAKIVAEAGPIIIGDYNIIEELVTIANRLSAEEDSGKVQIIGNNNIFEVGATVEAQKIGDHNVVESKAKIESKVEISNGCIIGAGCVLNTSEHLPDNTVVYGVKCERRIQRERPPAQTLQIDFLTKILPNYHYLMKPNLQPRPVAAAVKKREGFLNFTTSKYKLHFFETPSGLKFIMNTDLSVGNMKDVLQHIFSTLYVEYIVKNPLCELEQPITSELFKNKLDEYVRALPQFTTKAAS